MASALTPAEVAHIAALARLELSPGDQEMFARQLTDILAYAATIQRVDTTLVESAAASDAQAPLRPDEAIDGLARDTVLAEAPEAARGAGLFRVPKVL